MTGRRFVRPHETQARLATLGFTQAGIHGVAFNPVRWAVATGKKRPGQLSAGFRQGRLNMSIVSIPLFAPSREEGLRRMHDFLPRAGRAYAASRNHDFGPGARTNVSVLSPYVRHRLIGEWEIAEAVLGRYALSTAEKFIQEVCWRTYWKGWLEQRPEIWQRYMSDVTRLTQEVEADPARSDAYQRALSGETGIACFDAWVHELRDTGYLHNHARMWFASIWIYTLKLDWQLGADFFLRHLLDGDPASNTLSWRWVCGLHTPGKTYLARAANIAEYTQGRLDPRGQLAMQAPPLEPDHVPKAKGVRALKPLPSQGRVVLLVTEEDLSPETLALDKMRVAAIVIADTSAAYAGVRSRSPPSRKPLCRMPHGVQAVISVARLRW